MEDVQGHGSREERSRNWKISKEIEDEVEESKRMWIDKMPRDNVQFGLEG